MTLQAHAAHASDVLARALEGAADARQRRNAARALGHLGALARHAVYDLANAVGRDPDETVRAECARALARLGPVAAEAIPQLTAALRDPSSAVRAAAASTLDAIRAAMLGAREARGGR